LPSRNSSAAGDEVFVGLRDARVFTEDNSI
jgi:hypothetical protein